MTKLNARPANADSRYSSSNSCVRPVPRRGSGSHRRGFLLIMVLLVVSVISLASLNFSQSMLIAHESAKLDSQRFQARQMVESAIQVARVYASIAPVLREEQGGAWDNAQKWQALNIVPHMDPAFRGNVTFMAPSLDQAGSINGFRYGLQNESAKLNLNALVQIDKMASTMGASSVAGAAGAAGAGTTGGSSPTSPSGPPRMTGGPGGPAAGAFGSLGSATSSLASAATAGTNLGAKMLLGIPGMTEDVADAILDFLDEDDEPRQYGCEYSDYYQSLQPAYRPINGPLTSIEQLLLVRGVTAQLLYGYDQNRNGVLDASEQQNMMMGVQAGAPPGAMPTATANASNNGMASDGQTQLVPPSPLGWAPFMTLHSQERNVAADGTKRVNINMDDLQQLQADLEAAGVNELYVSYIIAYRIGGQPPPNASSPLQTLLTMMATSTDQDGVLGQQLSSMQQASAQLSGQGQGAQAQKQLWTSSALSSVDLTTAQGSVKFNQVLDLIDSSVTLGGQGGQAGGGGNTNQGGRPSDGGGGNNQPAGNAYASPINSSPLALADALPILMDKLTTVDSEALPGRINIMECPREILSGIPGMNEELVEKILEARVDGSQTENRKFETWLAVEGLVTMDQMRGFLPLLTCGGDVFKAQIVAYYEGAAPFCRAEAIISGIGPNPKVLFFRRLDHLGRAFNVMTLGQRTDIGLTPNTIKR